MKQSKSTLVIVHPKHAGITWILLSHCRLDLTSENSPNIFLITFKLNDREEMIIEPLKIIEALILPIVVVSLKPFLIIKDSTIYYQISCALASFWEMYLRPNVVFSV